MADSRTLKAIVVGGGISGLSAAWFLQERGIAYTLLEQSSRWGGKIRTEVVECEGIGRFVVEAGPDSFIAQKPWATQLARALGLGDELIGTNDDQRKIFVLNRGRLTPLPDGLLLIVPTRFMPFALSPLISIPGKLRMAVEPFLPPRHDDGDESLAAFVQRRLGAEILDKLAEPLMSGIYNTDPHDQSLLATFPRFRKLELEYGSLTRGMLASRRAAVNHKLDGAKPSSMFLSFKGGMEALVTRLVSALNGDLRLDTGVQTIERTDRYCVTLTDGTSLEADLIVLTPPAPIAADLIRPLAPDAAALVDAIRYVTTGTLSLAYRASDARLPRSFGVVIPRSENRPINAVTMSSIKFNHRAPDDYVLMRAFFGGSRSPQTVELDDATLVSVVRGELERIYGIRAEPLFTRTYRWRQATPQYAVGHLDRVDQIERALPPGLFLIGSAFRGVGVPDCVHQAQEIVTKALQG
ncbi:MAG: protoporphyrinogen oxidase [Anaerolineae bacterium]|nr:protoporphyrinogen oxidase [Anaerolineae bacterium]